VAAAAAAAEEDCHDADEASQESSALQRLKHPEPPPPPTMFLRAERKEHRALRRKRRRQGQEEEEEREEEEKEREEEKEKEEEEKETEERKRPDEISTNKDMFANEAAQQLYDKDIRLDRLRRFGFRLFPLRCLLESDVAVRDVVRDVVHEDTRIRFVAMDTGARAMEKDVDHRPIVRSLRQLPCVAALVSANRTVESRRLNLRLTIEAVEAVQSDLDPVVLMDPDLELPAVGVVCENLSNALQWASFKRWREEGEGLVGEWRGREGRGGQWSVERDLGGEDVEGVTARSRGNGEEAVRRSDSDSLFGSDDDSSTEEKGTREEQETRKGQETREEEQAKGEERENGDQKSESEGENRGIASMNTNIKARQCSESFVSNWVIKENTDNFKDESFLNQNLTTLNKYLAFSEDFKEYQTRRLRETQRLIRKWVNNQALI